jgi:hypothetical protein
MEVVLLPSLLPDRRKIRIFNIRNGMSVDAVVRDVGPWNLHDAYWDGTGRPKTEDQHRNGAPAENGHVPSNDAGIDMTPEVFDALGIPGPEDSRQAHVDWIFVGDRSRAAASARPACGGRARRNGRLVEVKGTIDGSASELGHDRC